MKKILLFFLLFMFAYSCELKIATFNVENLFDDKNNGNEYRDFKISKTGKSNWNSHKYNQKVKEISNLLKSLNADIIALQEIENDFVLKRLAKESGYKYRAFSKDTNSPVGVGILSKINIENKKVYKVKDVKTRDILRADFSLDGNKFSLYTTHFLAKNHRDKSKNYLRKADRIKNAKALQNAVKDSKNTIILGDFNTDYTPNSLLKDIINDGFVDLWSKVYSFERSSHITNRAIDHILLDESFLKDNKLVYKEGSFAKFDKKEFFNERYRASDHYPIYFTLKTDSCKSADENQDSTLKEDYKTSNIDKIYGKIIKSPVILKNLVVTYKDKFGISLSDKTGRGIYIYDKNSDINIGQKVDILVYKTNFYKDNFQINGFEILKTYAEKTNINNYLLKEYKISSARHGDVIEKVTGDVKNGKIYTKFGSFIIFSHHKRVKDGKNQTFNNVFFTTYKGNKEIIVK